MNDEQINREAEDLLFADMDSYADWLNSQCMGVPVDQTRIGYVPRDSARFAMFVEVLTVAQLLALSLYPDVQIAGKAMQEMRARYLKGAEKTGVILKFAADAQEALA